MTKEQINKLNISDKMYLAEYTDKISTLEILSKDEDKDVRLYVVRNEYTPNYVLADLAANEDELNIVKYYIARNSNINEDIMNILAKQDGPVFEYENKPPYKYVKEAIIHNKNITKDVLEYLSNDNDDFVKNQAKDKVNEFKNLENKNLLEVLDTYVDKDTNTNTHTR